MRSMRRTYRQQNRVRSRDTGSFWLSFSDLMSALVLIFILVMFYIMYQYFDMYELSTAEIARQQYDLEAAQDELSTQRQKLTAAEQEMIAAQIRLEAAQNRLTSNEEILAASQAELDAARVTLSEQQLELSQAQALLNEKETEVAAQQQTLTAQQQTLDALSVQLSSQQSQIAGQQQTLAQQQTQLDEQRAQIAQQQLTLDAQLLQIAGQQRKLDEQQLQIEALVGIRTRIISSLSEALKAANVQAIVDPTNGSIAIASDVLFQTGKAEMSETGMRSIDAFLPVYLDVLFSDEYSPYVSEIIIEGHTDSVGGYIHNLTLSQHRANTVATYILGDNYTGITYYQKMKLRELATANGRSFSNLIYVNGVEDKAASRRVVFKFRLIDEQMVEQLKRILED